MLSQSDCDILSLRITSIQMYKILGFLFFSAVLLTYFYFKNINYYNGPVSDHFDGKLFHNKYDEKERSFGTFLKWQKDRKPAPWSEYFDNGKRDLPPEFFDEEGIRVSFVGHATVLLQVGGNNILIDPVWSERASPFNFIGPKRVNPAGIDFDKLPKIHFVLISHNHYDHMDKDIIKKLHERDKPFFVVPLGNDTILKSFDSSINSVALDWYETQKYEDIKVHAVPSVHWSGRFGLDRNKALWGGFIVETQAGKIYYSGDTALESGKVFEDIYNKFGTPKLAIIPVGAYEPRWFMKSAHTNPEDAVKIFNILGKPKTLGVHWGTFQLSDESRENQITDFNNAIKKHEIEVEQFKILEPAEVWVVK